MRGGAIRWTTGSLAVLLVCGCQGTSSNVFDGRFAPEPLMHGPAHVAAQDYEYVWESVVDEIKRYFEVAYENRYDGRIETFAEASPSILEPWRRDVGSFGQRVESSLQSIRRRGFVLVQPSPAGGYAVTVEIYKELEHLNRPISTRTEAATFVRSVEPVEEGLVTSPVAAPRGWISLGRDLELEGKILARIEDRLGRNALLHPTIIPVMPVEP